MTQCAAGENPFAAATGGVSPATTELPPEQEKGGRAWGLRGRRKLEGVLFKIPETTSDVGCAVSNTLLHRSDEFAKPAFSRNAG